MILKRDIYLDLILQGIRWAVEQSNSRAVEQSIRSIKQGYLCRSSPDLTELFSQFFGAGRGSNALALFFS